MRRDADREGGNKGMPWLQALILGTGLVWSLRAFQQRQPDALFRLVWAWALSDSLGLLRWAVEQ